MAKQKHKVFKDTLKRIETIRRRISDNRARMNFWADRLNSAETEGPINESYRQSLIGEVLAASDALDQTEATFKELYTNLSTGEDASLEHLKAQGAKVDDLVLSAEGTLRRPELINKTLDQQWPPEEGVTDAEVCITCGRVCKGDKVKVFSGQLAERARYPHFHFYYVTEPIGQQNHLGPEAVLQMHHATGPAILGTLCSDCVWRFGSNAGLNLPTFSDDLEHGLAGITKVLLAYQSLPWEEGTVWKKVMRNYSLNALPYISPNCWNRRSHLDPTYWEYFLDLISCAVSEKYKNLKPKRSRAPTVLILDYRFGQLPLDTIAIAALKHKARGWC